MPFSGIKLVKYIPYVIAGILLVAVIWKINSIFDENTQLHKKISETETTLEQYIKSDEKSKQIISAMQTRLDELKKIEDDRNNRVQKKLESGKKYLDDTKLGVQTTEDVDKFLMDRYNGILECIEKVTKNEDDNC